MGLYVEAEQHDVAVLDDIVLAFGAEFTRLAGRRLATERDIVLVGHGLGADEAALEVAVDDARRLGAFDPFSTVQARASFGPTVKKVIRSSSS